MSKLYRIDKILWGHDAVPYCPVHRLEMDFWTFDEEGPVKYDHVRCAECEKAIELPREMHTQQEYVLRKLKAIKIKDYKVIDIDGESIPLAKARDEDESHFVEARLLESKVGKRLVVYAGSKEDKDKAQIFVEPEIERLAFDQNNLKPSEVFVYLEGQFKGGTKNKMSDGSD